MSRRDYSMSRRGYRFPLHDTPLAVVRYSKSRRDYSMSRRDYRFPLQDTP